MTDTPQEPTVEEPVETEEQLEDTDQVVVDTDQVVVEAADSRDDDETQESELVADDDVSDPPS
jgi:hypothetical protein